MNRLIVLGCHSPSPGPGGATPGYLLQVKEKNYLIDCGSGVLAQLAKYIPLAKLDGVFLSHLHSDHFSDFLTLQYGIWLSLHLKERTNSVPVYSPNRPIDRFKMLPYKEAFEVLEISEGLEVTLAENASIRFYQTEHAIPCYAMRIQVGSTTILYGADSGPNTNWSKMERNPNLAILESTFPISMEPKEPTGHLSSRQAGQVAKQMQAKELWLTHLYPAINPELLVKEAKASYQGKIQAAYSGLSFEFN
ncbi:MBL fold metallo-hydrolase [Risungbinella massiliensis]|uniref:MBL fold metallo-hydrolase n=1 Tax=Risungbinella massiliensis TaxID=1329796 RepID=UPI0005CC2EC3|nr:MBL fold metallo-hydrolase [Risungbinella massiliensis]